MSRDSGKSFVNYTRLIGLVVLIVLLTRVDFGKIGAILKDVQPAFLVAAILLNLPQLGLKALRWRFLLKLQGVSYPLRKAVLVYFSSVYVGILTPGRLGELVKALYLEQDTKFTVGEGMSSVLVDRLFDLYALIGAGSYGLIVFAYLVQLPAWTPVVILLGFVLSLLVLVPAVGNFGFRLLVRIPRVGSYVGRLQPQVQGFYASLLALFRPQIVVAVLLTGVAHTLFYLQCYLLVRALGLPLQFNFILFAMAMVNVINLLPVTISGLGTREAILGLLFSSVQLSIDTAVAYSTLVVVTFYVAAAVLGGLAWSLAPLDPARMQFLKSRRDESVGIELSGERLG